MDYINIAHSIFGNIPFPPKTKEMMRSFCIAHVIYLLDKTIIDAVLNNKNMSSLQLNCFYLVIRLANKLYNTLIKLIIYGNNDIELGTIKKIDHIVDKFKENNILHIIETVGKENNDEIFDLVEQLFLKDKQTIFSSTDDLIIQAVFSNFDFVEYVRELICSVIKEFAIDCKQQFGLNIDWENDSKYPVLEKYKNLFIKTQITYPEIEIKIYHFFTKMSDIINTKLNVLHQNIIVSMDTISRAANNILNLCSLKQLKQQEYTVLLTFMRDNYRYVSEDNFVDSIEFDVYKDMITEDLELQMWDTPLEVSYGSSSSVTTINDNYDKINSFWPIGNWNNVLNDKTEKINLKLSKINLVCANYNNFVDSFGKEVHDIFHCFVESIYGVTYDKILDMFNNYVFSDKDEIVSNMYVMCGNKPLSEFVGFHKMDNTFLIDFYLYTWSVISDMKIVFYDCDLNCQIFGTNNNIIIVYEHSDTEYYILEENIYNIDKEKIII